MSTMFTVDGRDVASYVSGLRRTPQKPVRERHYPRPAIATQIIEQVAREHSVSVQLMISERHWRELAYARFDAFSRLRALVHPNGKPRFSLPHIGWLLGGRDHSTVKSGIARWEKIQSAKREAEAA